MSHQGKRMEGFYVSQRMVRVDVNKCVSCSIVVMSWLFFVKDIDRRKTIIGTEKKMQEMK